VLFIDEIANLGYLQRHLLTAMQEKRFPITGRNATSSGASVKVENVPCDFILVAAVNITDAQSILPPLRSRVAGNGYEVLLKTAMPDTEENRAKFCQFVAQEICKDGRIPHASADALSELLDEARRRARLIDEESNALTLRLRDVSGLVKSAGDVAQAEGAQLIDAKHVREALGRSRTLEEQLRQRYGDSWWKAGAADAASRKDAGKGGII
jgi:lon-related putative ATP-dependent protease